MSKLSNKLSFIKKFISKNYGIGKVTCNFFSNLVGTNKRIEPKNLKRKQTSSFFSGINTVTRYRTLKEIIKINILFLIENKTYKGVRHKAGQPVRGQRTHTNAKTRKKII
jgi:small subunit ribosomal protein S13